MTLPLRRKHQITPPIYRLRLATGREARWSAAAIGLLTVASWAAALPAEESDNRSPSAAPAWQPARRSGTSALRQPDSTAGRVDQQELDRQSSERRVATVARDGTGQKRGLKWQPRRATKYRWTSAAHRQVAHNELVFDAETISEPETPEPPVEVNAPMSDPELADAPASDEPAPANDPFESTSPMPAETTPSEESEMDLELPQDAQMDLERKPGKDERQRRADELAESQDACKKAASDLKRIHSIDLDIKVSGRAGDDFPLECAWGDAPFESRSWAETIYTWKPSALCHKPLYFEEEALERYGHCKGPYLQPLYSAAHFFVMLPVLPYNMGVKTPHECEYALGHYRPGSCAPYFIYPLPISLRGALAQAGAVVGTAAVLP